MKGAGGSVPLTPGQKGKLRDILYAELTRGSVVVESLEKFLFAADPVLMVAALNFYGTTVELFSAVGVDCDASGKLVVRTTPETAAGEGFGTVQLTTSVASKSRLGKVPSTTRRCMPKLRVPERSGDMASAAVGKPFSFVYDERALESTSKSAGDKGSESGFGIKDAGDKSSESVSGAGDACEKSSESVDGLGVKDTGDKGSESVSGAGDAGEKSSESVGGLGVKDTGDKSSESIGGLGVSSTADDKGGDFSVTVTDGKGKESVCWFGVKDTDGKGSESVGGVDSFSTTDEKDAVSFGFGACAFGLNKNDPFGSGFDNLPGFPSSESSSGAGFQSKESWVFGFDSADDKSSKSGGSFDSLDFKGSACTFDFRAADYQGSASISSSGDQGKTSFDSVGVISAGDKGSESIGKSTVDQGSKSVGSFDGPSYRGPSYAGDKGRTEIAPGFISANSSAFFGDFGRGEQGSASVSGFGGTDYRGNTSVSGSSSGGQGSKSVRSFGSGGRGSQGSTTVAPGFISANSAAFGAPGQGSASVGSFDDVGSRGNTSVNGFGSGEKGAKSVASSGGPADRGNRVVDGFGTFRSFSSDRSSKPPAPSNKAGREDGVVVKVLNSKMFIRGSSQRIDCPERELYFANFSQLRDKKDSARINAGVAVSFCVSLKVPNPNPSCFDVVILDGVPDDGGKVAPAPKVQMISDVKACAAACSGLSFCRMVALDCICSDDVYLGDAVRVLRLVLVAAQDAGVFLFDVWACRDLFDAGLRALCENSKVVKTVHDCRMDVVALRACKVELSPVFDSQLAYSTLEGSPGDASLADVAKNVLRLRDGARNLAPDSAVWGKRPLSAEARSYAATDVQLLLLVAESERFKRMSGAHVMSVFWKTRARISEALRLEDRVDAPPEAGVDAYESFARAHALCVSSTSIKIQVDTEYDTLLECLPPRVSALLTEKVAAAESRLVDVVMDLDRPVCFVRSQGPDVRDDSCVVTRDDIALVLAKCGPITDSNRACVGSSLHRCSVIRDPQSHEVVGLTLRMARSVRGLADMIWDVIGAGKSVLLVGPPGLGKTTLLRDVACTLARERRVMVVDTNNEIAGEHTLPHRAIGRARRMKVGNRAQQYQRMLEAVQNHTPQTLVIDEIGTKQEVVEAVGVKQRGVQLIATTHGRTLADVILNPHLRDLLGGVNTVILSAAERAKEQSASKTRNERKMEPAFDVCVELVGVNKWRLHHNIDASVDAVLRQLGEVVDCEVRQLMPEDGRVVTTHESYPSEQDAALFEQMGANQ